MDKLRSKTVQDTTSKTYLAIWRQFNCFLIRLDWRPPSWEEKTALFCTYLIDKGNQSATVRSYVSAIKAVLAGDGYSWDNTKIFISSLTQACKLMNDRVKCRLPIQRPLSDMILFELARIYHAQPYLFLLYQAAFSLAYYRLMRVGEIAEGNGRHAVKAKNIHIGRNKNKLMIVLHTSKTHGKESYPQKIKIRALEQYDSEQARSRRHFCPFTIVRQFAALRGAFDYDHENFFVFRDGGKLTPEQFRKTLRMAVASLGLDPLMYDTHSYRIGRTVDLAKDGYSFLQLKVAGRWKSNAVLKYLKFLDM